MTISYFDRSAGEKGGEQTPIYAITFELYENGVSRALLLDYGDFVLSGEMTSLEMKDASPARSGRLRRHRASAARYVLFLERQPLDHRPLAELAAHAVHRALGRGAPFAPASIRSAGSASSASASALTPTPSSR